MLQVSVLGIAIVKQRFHVIGTDDTGIWYGGSA
jgi:hypothetical protein